MSNRSLGGGTNRSFRSICCATLPKQTWTYLRRNTHSQYTISHRLLEHAKRGGQRRAFLHRPVYVSLDRKVRLWVCGSVSQRLMPNTTRHENKESKRTYSSPICSTVHTPADKNTSKPLMQSNSRALELQTRINSKPAYE